jgi:pyruvate formate-lyase/glycerol dehydratase family glycyl radical enzyme
MIFMKGRISELRKLLLDAKPEICPERIRIFTKSMKSTEGEPIVIRRAKAFEDVLENMSLYIGQKEIIIGNQASKPKASPIYLEYSYKWLEKEFEGNPYYFNERPGDKFYYSEETKAEILDLIRYWKGKTVYENLRKNLPRKANEAWEAGIIDDTWVSSSGLGNILVDFNQVLQEGLSGIIEKAEERKSRIDLKMPDEYKKLWFLDAVIITNKAVINFSRRLMTKCEKLMLDEKDELRIKELSRLIEITSNVPDKPARNFWEALQSVWIILLALHIEANGHAISLGRFDQYLYPYLKKDLETGILNREQALELVEAFFIKVNELNKLRSWPDTTFFLGYQMFVNLAVAGRTPDNQDATNTLSELCVEACEELKLFTPSVSVLVFEKTSKDFIKKALNAAYIHKGGQPAFYNDELFRKILSNMGIDEEDLVNWAPVGCIEAAIQGKWDYAAKGPWLSVAKVLELTLNGGVDPKTSLAFLKSDKNLENFSSTEEIFEEFKRQLHYFMELQVITEHINDEMHKQIDLNAFRSSLVKDCIERGATLIEGGSIYSADGGPTAGSITSGDCLAAIEKIIFKDKIITKKQLMHAIETNFEDNETDPTGDEIRGLLVSRAPKFGNDDDEADRWSAMILEYIGSTYQRDFRNSRFGKGPIPACYAFSQSPVTGNLAFGSMIGALPNGRKSGEPVNNGISPSNGAEKMGPTAAINSLCKMPSIWFQKGAIFNMRLNENAFSSDENLDRIVSLILVMIKNGGQHVQFNVVGNKMLRDAQKYPEKYADLMVRVSGYSALFTPLDSRVQEDIISRTEFTF